MVYNLGNRELMMDYNKTRAEVDHRQGELKSRQNQIGEEIAKLVAEREQIKRELIGLEQIIEGLEFAESDFPIEAEPVGFTDRIRQILRATTIPLVPTQIRDALLSSGVQASSHKTLLINVHTVLTRIDSELEKVRNGEGKLAYGMKRNPGELARGLATLLPTLNKAAAGMTTATHRTTRETVRGRRKRKTFPPEGYKLIVPSDESK